MWIFPNDFLEYFSISLFLSFLSQIFLSLSFYLFSEILDISVNIIIDNINFSIS